MGIHIERCDRSTCDLDGALDVAVSGSDDTVIAVSLYSNKAVAEGSTAKLMPWIRENLGPLLASPPEAIDGEVLICEVV